MNARLRLALMLSCSLAGAGCGEEAPPAPSGSSNWEMLFKATAPAPEGVSALQVTLRRFELHLVPEVGATPSDPADTSIDADGRWTELNLLLPVDVTKTTTEAAAPKAGLLTVPVGRINQVRVTFETTDPKSHTATTATETCSLDVTAVPATGTKMAAAFRPLPSRRDQSNTMVLELDTAKSFTFDADTRCWKFSPVVRLARAVVAGLDFPIAP
jgi:hypothetical protein